MNHEEILKALRDADRAAEENHLAWCREMAESDDATGHTLGARHWRERIAEIEARLRPCEDRQAAA